MPQPPKPTAHEVLQALKDRISEIENPITVDDQRNMLELIEGYETEGVQQDEITAHLKAAYHALMAAALGRSGMARQTADNIQALLKKINIEVS